MKQQNFSMMIVFLFLLTFLASCDSPTTAIRNFNSESSSDELTIYTVEFYSRVPVPFVTISIRDTNEKEIARKTSSIEGAASFPSLKEDHHYVAVTLNAKEEEQSRFPFKFDKRHARIVLETFYANSSVGLAVPKVLQNPELPNGCEITSLTAMLNYVGVKTNKMEMKKNYLPRETTEVIKGIRYGPNPEVAYAGNPASKTDGFYVFAQPITDAGNAILQEQSLPYRARNITKATHDEILTLVDDGYPVLTWVTIDWQKPRTNSFWIVKDSGEKHPIYSNLHAVVLTQYDERSVTVMNPLHGYETIAKQTFFDSYDALGAHAVVIQ